MKQNSLSKNLNAKSGSVFAKSFFINKISLAIKKGNVAGILGTIQPTSTIKETFYLNG